MTRRTEPAGERAVGQTSRVEINLSAIDHNLSVIERVLAGRTDHAPATLCAVIKGDAYGMGARRIARRIASKVAMFAVYSLQQARDLVESGIGTPILVLMPVHALDRRDVLYGSAVRGQLHLSVHDNQTLDALIDVANGMGLRLPIHLEVDTGLGRCGSTPDEAFLLAKRIARQPRLKLAGVFTHCSCSDNDARLTEDQACTLDEWLDRAREANYLPEDAIIHQASTFAMFRGDQFHRSMVRVGLSLFGYASEEFSDASEFQHTSEARTLRPAVRWVSEICQTRWIEKDAKVGYGGTWTAPRQTRTAIVPVGYADGYPLALSNNAKVAIVAADAGETIRAFATVLGRVSMDQIVIDITDIPEPMARVGSEVELIGTDPAAPNHLPTLARNAGLISHAMMCAVSPRLPRSYVSETGSDEPIIVARTVGAAGAGRSRPGALTTRAVV